MYSVVLLSSRTVDKCFLSPGARLSLASGKAFQKKEFVTLLGYKEKLLNIV